MTDTTTPRLQRLDILVTDGQTSLVEAARCAWTEFEGTTRLPFTYEELTCDVCNEAATSAWAEMQIYPDGVAKIRVTPRCLDAPSDERQLTLLHESLHIASFVGPLHEMYEAAKRPRASHVHQMAHFLGKYMFEVDAELALAMQYPELARNRAAYYIKVQEDVRLQEQTSGLYSRVSPGNPMRPYYVLADRLAAELAGLLAQDEDVEIRLSTNLEQPPHECADRVEMLRRMLSPKLNNYADLPQWGPARYEAVVRHIQDVQSGD